MDGRAPPMGEAAPPHAGPGNNKPPQLVLPAEVVRGVASFASTVDAVRFSTAARHVRAALLGASGRLRLETLDLWRCADDEDVDDVAGEPSWLPVAVARAVDVDRVRVVRVRVREDVGVGSGFPTGVTLRLDDDDDAPLLSGVRAVEYFVSRPAVPTYASSSDDDDDDDDDDDGRSAVVSGGRAARGVPAIGDFRFALRCQVEIAGFRITYDEAHPLSPSGASCSLHAGVAKRHRCDGAVVVLALRVAGARRLFTACLKHPDREYSSFLKGPPMVGAIDFCPVPPRGRSSFREEQTSLDDDASVMMGEFAVRCEVLDVFAASDFRVDEGAGSSATWSIARGARALFRRFRHPDDGRAPAVNDADAVASPGLALGDLRFLVFPYGLARRRGAADPAVALRLVEYGDTRRRAFDVWLHDVYVGRLVADLGLPDFETEDVPPQASSSSSSSTRDLVGVHLVAPRARSLLRRRDEFVLRVEELPAAAAASAVPDPAQFTRAILGSTTWAEKMSALDMM